MFLMFNDILVELINTVFDDWFHCSVKWQVVITETAGLKLPARMFDYFCDLTTVT